MASQTDRGISLMPWSYPFLSGNCHGHDIKEMPFCLCGMIWEGRLPMSKNQNKNYYGNHETRRRARKLTAQELKPGLWLVTGGEMGHGVTVNGGDPPVYECDCNGQKDAKDGMCSHCLAVWAQVNGNQDFLKVASMNPGGQQ